MYVTFEAVQCTLCDLLAGLKCCIALWVFAARKRALSRKRPGVVFSFDTMPYT
jgi:hypothetical protein